MFYGTRQRNHSWPRYLRAQEKTVLGIVAYFAEEAISRHFEPPLDHMEGGLGMTKQAGTHAQSEVRHHRASQSQKRMRRTLRGRGRVSSCDIVRLFLDRLQAHQAAQRALLDPSGPYLLIKTS